MRIGFFYLHFLSWHWMTVHSFSWVTLSRTLSNSLPLVLPLSLSLRVPTLSLSLSLSPSLSALRVMFCFCFALISFVRSFICSGSGLLPLSSHSLSLGPFSVIFTARLLLLCTVRESQASCQRGFRSCMSTVITYTAVLLRIPFSPNPSKHISPFVQLKRKRRKRVVLPREFVPSTPRTMSSFSTHIYPPPSASCRPRSVSRVGRDLIHS